MKNGDGNGVPSQNPFLSRPRDRKRRKLPKRLQTILLHSWGLKRFFCMALRMEQLSVMTQAIRPYFCSRLVYVRILKYFCV